MLVCLFAAVPLCCSCEGGGSGRSVTVAKAGGTRQIARAGTRYLEVHTEAGWKRYTVKGCNIGTALPGRWFSEFPADKELYRDWFEKIAAMNANAIRVYTLLDPTFYSTLVEFNRQSGKKLLLLQEVWPDDEVPGHNLYDPGYMQAYKDEITRDIDALAGNANIPERRGRAWGDYTANVFPYLLGVLIGREITWEEAKATNDLNGRSREYNGPYVRAKAGSNSVEAWLAGMCDFAVGRMQERQGWQAPVAFVSWPTLDPMVHPTELTPGGSKETEHEDTEVLDPSHLSRGPKARAGLFGCYHIYPYYPDFMNREPAYAEYRDGEGVLRYGGYLRQFMAVHPRYPALIGEFGVPTSMGVAHLNPEGFNHGGVGEQDQGLLLGRMMDGIIREKYAGGVIFEWADEWAKRTWVDMPYMIPFDRHIFWHNLMDPEQNFGVLAFEPSRRAFKGGETSIFEVRGKRRGGKPEGAISGLRADADEAFLHLAVGLDRGYGASLKPGAGGDAVLMVGIDTFGADNGTTALPFAGLPSLPTGAEFLLKLSAEEGGLLLARPDYSRGTSRFAAAPATDPKFVPVRYIINRRQVSQADGTVFKEQYINDSVLRYGSFDPGAKEYDSLANWEVSGSGDTVHVRIPWLLLNVSDPSSHTVLHDERTDLPPGPAALRVEYGTDALGVTKTDGFRFYVATGLGGRLLDFQPRRGRRFKSGSRAFLWPGWEEPRYRPRLKRSYTELTERLGSIE